MDESFNSNETVGGFISNEIDGGFISLLSVDGGVHRKERVIMLDGLEDMVVCYINDRQDGREIHPMSRLKEVFCEYNSHGTEKHRYWYHGGERGIINGFFEFTDRYVYIYPSANGGRSMASISSYNMAHFMCDVLESGGECESLLEWVGRNAFWKSVVKETMKRLNLH